MKSAFYAPFKNVRPEPSTSSYGRWIVRTSEASMEYFWDKKGATKFAVQHNKNNGWVELPGLPRCDACNTVLKYKYTTMRYTCPICHTSYK